MVGGAVNLNAVRTQVEYYFSDSNLPRDKFLRAKTEENEAGFVDISVLLTFNRLAALSKNPEKIAEALAGSSILELDETQTRVRRAKPLPETPEWRNRAIYAKGWNARGPEPSIEAVKELFEPSGEILSVRIRRWGDETGRHFKGSVFVEFATPEAAERAVAEEYDVDTTDEGGKIVRRKLEILAVEAYFDRKRQENKQRRERARGRAANGGGKKNGPKKGPKKDSQKDEGAGDNVKEEDDVKQEDDICDTKREPVKAEPKPAVKREPRELVRGMVLRFEGFGPDVTREDIKEAFEPHGEVAWVDFRRGDADGHVRFHRAGAAQTAADAMKTTEFGGKLPKMFVIEGEAEEAYWKQTWEQQDAVAERSKKRRRDGGRGFGNKRRRGRGRGRGRF